MSRRRHAYILPMTLVILALAGLVLARVCRSAMRESVQVAADSRDLQRKWAVLSCQSTFLANADVLLARRAQASAGPLLPFHADLTLGEETIHLVFADEQAKVNLNGLYKLRGRQETDQFVRLALRRAGVSSQVQLRPLHRSGQSSANEAPTLFSSFGQLFADSGDTARVPSLIAATAHLTCWGSGKLNYRRASSAEISELAGNEPQVLQQILFRQKSPASLALALNPLNISSRDGKMLDDQFTETSGCFSLWILATDGLFSQARFCVAEMGGDGRSHVAIFSW